MVGVFVSLGLVFTFSPSLIVLGHIWVCFFSPSRGRLRTRVMIEEQFEIILLFEADGSVISRDPRLPLLHIEQRRSADCKASILLMDNL